MNERPSEILATQHPYGAARTKVRDAGGAPAPASDVMYADCASTANQASLSGTPTIDGVASSGKRVFLWKQTTVAQNKIYSVSSAGVWAPVAQPKVVVILNGTTQGQTYFVLTAVNTYSPGGAYFK